MDRLRIKDVKRLQALSIVAKFDPTTTSYIDTFIKTLKSNPTQPLSDIQIKHLASNGNVKKLMILLFLAENITLEFIRRNKKTYNQPIVLVLNFWDDIQETLIKKLLISRDIRASLFQNDDPAWFQHLVDAAKTILIDYLASEEFVSANKDILYRLLITGKYSQEGTELTHQSNKAAYTLHDRKTCCHVGLYDAFQFEEPQTTAAFRFLNTNPNRKTIYALFTLQFAYPELTVLNIDGTFSKIPAEEIPNFLNKYKENNEINEALYNAIKGEYPALFYPPLDEKSLQTIAQKIEALIFDANEAAKEQHKPLLIVLSEVHGSKGSFLLHVIVTRISHRFGIKHLLAETINIYHAQYGWDALVDPMIRLLSFAEEQGFEVKDLEEALHYNNELSPYPYHEIPDEKFGIPAREASWIIDAKALRKNAIFILGSGHMNSILNSELTEMYHMLPIDCTCDKAFSDMLNISQHHFIDLDKSINQFSLDEIIEMTTILKIDE
jgi:hypothetical protein